MIPLVLLPGMMCDGRLFLPQIAAFSADHALLIPTLTDHDSMTGLAGAVLSNAPSRFALAGLSMGGIVAMEIMRLAPERVDRIAFLDTNPLAETEATQKKREPQIKSVRAGHLRDVMRDEMKPNYLAPGPRRTEILDTCMAMAQALGPDVFVRQSRALQGRRDQQDTLRGVTVPALVLCGEHDVPCPPSRHELMHDLIAGSVLEIIPDAGHLTALEQPDATNRALGRWLSA